MKETTVLSVVAAPNTGNQSQHASYDSIDNRTKSPQSGSIRCAVLQGQ